MPDTHDYPTKLVLGKALDDTHVLVGESGGLSAVYENEESSAMPGLQAVLTEHGPLYLDPDVEYLVYDEESHTDAFAAWARGESALDNPAAEGLHS